MEMPIFVNREEELQQILDAVDTLQNKRRLLKTPIIQFSGVQGIGKTTLLQKVKSICDGRNLVCFENNAEDVTWHDFSKKVEILARKEPVVIILDALDTLDSERFQNIAVRLNELLEYGNLFVVLASRNVQRFERTRSINRKLTILQLKPLEQKHCFRYLSHFAHIIPSDVQDIIFSWTRGYPLAMTEMTKAIQEEGLDPRQEQDQKKLLRILMDKVVENALLANASLPAERTRLQMLLTVLSIPRRFNLTLAQDLIEHFANQYKLESSLAYITLPQTINEVTNVLSYTLERAAYCIDTPVRNLLHLHYKIEESQQYVEIHKFLAAKNESFAQAVTGPHHIPYLREFFYHLACCEEDAVVQKHLEQPIRQLSQVQGQDEHTLLLSLESFLQFYQEFLLDEELKDALGPQNTHFVQSLMYKNFLEIYKQIPEEMQGTWFKQFFSLVTDRPQKDDFALVFEEGMHQIIKQISMDEAIMLYNELIQDAGLKTLLGEQFENVKMRILASLPDEG